MDDLVGPSRQYSLRWVPGFCHRQLCCGGWQHVFDSGIHSSLVNQSVLSFPSFAKINWSLQILGKRPDGYHEIKTQLQTISLHDDLHFQIDEGGGLSLTCDDPEIPTDDQNLVIWAAAALRNRFEVKAGARVRLEKRIPTQAGLGGGSSNAAVTLLALTHLWELKPS